MKSRKDQLLKELAEVRKTERRWNYERASNRLADVSAAVEEYRFTWAIIDTELDMLSVYANTGEWQEMIKDLDKENDKVYAKFARLKKERTKCENAVLYFKELVDKS